MPADMSARTLAAVFLAGVILRAAVLPHPGPVDVLSQKLWSFGAASDVTGIYGVGGTPPERRFVKWRDISGPVDYPPIALYELAVVGKVYRAIDPLYSDSALLTCLVKTPALIAELFFFWWLLVWGRRQLGERGSRWAAAAFWLNPAIWYMGSALGYVDAQAAIPATLAVVAAAAGHGAAAGALIALAAGTKPQNVYLVPLIAMVLAGRGQQRWRELGRAAIAGLVVTAVVVLPFIMRGAWPNLIQAVSRLLHHNMLSGQAPNVGWILTWILRVWYAVPDMGWHDALALKIRILQISRVIELGYPDPRMFAGVLTWAAVVWAALRARHASTAGALTLAGWTMYAYYVLAIPVHENHLYPAIPLLVIAATQLPGLRPYYWILSGVLVLTNYLFYGLGDGRPPLIDRGWTFVDLSVLLAVANVLVFIWMTVRIRAITTGDNAVHNPQHHTESTWATR
jgi:hypothetical protein